MRPASLWILFTFAAASVWGQPGPGTAEFRVNTSRNDFQAAPAVSQNAAGEFVVAWRAGEIYSGYGGNWSYTESFSAQRFDNAGRARGGELQVDSGRSEYGYGPDVAVDDAGRFLVVWATEGAMAGTGTTFARRYGGDGEPLGEREEIGGFGVPALAGDEAGNALAVWSYPGYSPRAVSGRIFDAASGTWQEPFAIQEGEQRIVPAHVAHDAAGGFVVVWGRGEEVLGRRFSSTGKPREEELVLNQEPASWIDTGDKVSVGTDADGGFVVAWNRWEGGPRSVRVRRFDASGAPRGDEVVLSSDAGFPATPVVAVDTVGEHLVAWTRLAGDDPLLGVAEPPRWELAGRWLDVGGNARGGTFPLLYTARASIRDFDLAMSPSGRLAVAFASGDDIYARLLPPSGRGGVLQLVEEPGGLPWSALVEHDVTVQVQVVRTGGVAGEASVEHFTAGGSATPGEDFTSAPGRLVFAEGEYLKSFPLTVYDDEAREGDEELVVGLREAEGALLRPPAVWSATIYDDESTLPGEGPLPRGEKLRVNSTAGGTHLRPRVAVGTDGSFLVVWGSDGIGPQVEWRVLGQLYDADGRAHGGELMISKGPRLPPPVPWPGPAVAATPGGGFLVTWTEDTKILGRRITSAGRLGEELDLGTCTDCLESPGGCGGYCTAARGTEVTVHSDGSFAVFWAGEFDTGLDGFIPYHFVEGELFDELSRPVRRIFREGAGTDALGRFHVALLSLRQGGVLAVWLDEDGFLQGERFGTSSTTGPERYVLAGNGPSAPALVQPRDGVLLFHGNLTSDPPGGPFGGLSNTTGSEIFGRRLDERGAPIGEFFGVNGLVPGDQTDPRAAASPSGEHIVVWTSEGEPELGHRSIVARRYDADGHRIGRRFAVRPSDRLQSAPDVAMAPNGDFVVVWQEEADDGGTDVYAQPYVGSSCISGGRKLCLNQGRFELTVTWRNFRGGTGEGHAVPVTDDTGAFYFFGPENLELMVKVLDGRHLTGHYWVFYGSLSNVEFTLKVTDTSNGQSKSYVNPLGKFASVGDTHALPGD